MIKKGVLIFLLFCVIFFGFPNKVSDEVQSYPEPSNIEQYVFEHQSYDQIIKTFKGWEVEKAPKERICIVLKSAMNINLEITKFS
jgi:hypothetical protein